MNNNGISSEIKDLVGTMEDYFSECIEPKIKSDVETDVIQDIKTISNYIPYSLEIKEASDMAMIVKNLLNLVQAYDAYPIDYSSVGYATGAVAYYIVQMSDGHGMFGWRRLDESLP
jgi:hypothetical protein